MQNIAERDTVGFAAAAPKLFDDYHTALTATLEHQNEKWTFPKTVLPIFTLNLPPNVICAYHKDSKDRAIGMCGIKVLGKFNSKTGGHLVLPELKLALEFPSGTVICIPSSTLAHGNLPVKEGESRASFTQFATAGTFHYHEYGYNTSDELKEKDKDKWDSLQGEHRSLAGLKQLRFFSRLEDLDRERLAFAAPVLKGMSFGSLPPSANTHTRL